MWQGWGSKRGPGAHLCKDVCKEQGLLLLLGAAGVAGGSRPHLCTRGTGILFFFFPAVWWGNWSDPCVFLPAGVKKRTKVIKNNVNPVWNEVSVSLSLSPSLWGTVGARRVLWVQAQQGALSTRGLRGSSDAWGLSPHGGFGVSPHQEQLRIRNSGHWQWRSGTEPAPHGPLLQPLPLSSRPYQG